MNHVFHIQKNKEFLDARWEILRSIREFFWSRNFTEVETPLILHIPGQEPYLSPMKVSLHNEKQKNFQGFLHTSPEYTLKKMLAAGYEKIFSLGKVFRDYESFGGTHNPEFTMIEWYRANERFTVLMDDVEALFYFLAKKFPQAAASSLSCERMHMRDAWKRYAGVNLDEYLEKDAMFNLCEKKGYKPEKKESYVDLFYRIFLNEIEPKFQDHGLVLLHHYPKEMAALSQLSQTEVGYAERVEAYVQGLEIANGFGELTNGQEQEKRLVQEQSERNDLGKEIFPLDKDFIEAVGMMPPSVGISIGVDRLVQLFTGCQNIDSVLVLPASKLFDSSDIGE